MALSSGAGGSTASHANDPGGTHQAGMDADFDISGLAPAVIVDLMNSLKSKAAGGSKVGRFILAQSVFDAVKGLPGFPASLVIASSQQPLDRMHMDLRPPQFTEIMIEQGTANALTAGIAGFANSFGQSIG